MADKLSKADEDYLMNVLKRVNEPLPDPVESQAPIVETSSRTWHIKAESEKGCFQWLVDEDGNIIDCPYHLRGYWIGRLVDMVRLLEEHPPTIFVRCTASDRLDAVRTTSLEVFETHMTSLPDYAYAEPYLGGLYDLTSM